MGEWAHFELATGNLAAVVLGTEEFLGHMIADRYQSNPLRELLALAASNYMNASDYAQFKSLSERWKTAAGIRNKIVHGQWRVNIFDDEAIPATYSRFSHIWDRETAIKEANMAYQNSQSLRDKMTFNAERIVAEGEKARLLGDEINHFALSCILRRQTDILESASQKAEPRQLSETDLLPRSTTTLNFQHIRGW